MGSGIYYVSRIIFPKILSMLYVSVLRKFDYFFQDSEKQEEE